MRPLILGFALLGGAARAEDGGVFELRSAVVVLSDESVRSLGPGLYLDEPSAIARARELAALRAEAQEWRKRALAAPVCSPTPSTIGATTLGALAVLAASLLPLLLPR